MKFRLEIELGNNAMRFRTDVETALQAVARRFHYSGKPEAGEHENIRDLNGNTVGKWEVVEGPKPCEECGGDLQGGPDGCICDPLNDAIPECQECGCKDGSCQHSA